MFYFNLRVLSDDLLIMIVVLVLIQMLCVRGIIHFIHTQLVCFIISFIPTHLVCFTVSFLAS